MSRIFLLVGIGGFIGSVVRYYFSHLINLNFPSSFPLGTFIVNLSGCLLIGIIFGFSEKGNGRCATILLSAHLSARLSLP